MRGTARVGEDRRPCSCRWAGQESNLRTTDYESAALTAELPARVPRGYPARVLTYLSRDDQTTFRAPCWDGAMTFAMRKLAIGATGLAVLAGTGGAYAATQSSGPSTAK